MQNKYRRCQVYGVEGTSRFYDFTDVSVPANDRGTYMVKTKLALVELPNGQCDMVDPINVKFLDRDRDREKKDETITDCNIPEDNES